MMNASSTVSHIVLIDDSPSDVYLMKLALEESGLQFEMTSFQSGTEALLALCPAAGDAADPLIPDLILLDLNTPCSDGFEVLSRIRGNPGLSHVPVAIITSSASPTDKHRAALGGATTYIKKPTQLRAFMDGVGTAVKQLLANGRS
jgi:two-component system response regulator